jgi:hypothetical protein
MESLHDPMSTDMHMEGSVLALRNIWTAYFDFFLIFFITAKKRN